VYQLSRVLRQAKVFTKKILAQRELGVIYMLHRCSPLNRDNLVWNEHMKVSPGFLKNFIEAKQSEYRFISLNELSEISRNKRKLKKPFIILTFDDGYKDNYEYALPLLDRMRVPFTVYVTTSFPGRTAFLWWYVLEEILKKNDAILLSDGQKFSCTTKEEKEAAFLLIRKIILSLNQNDLTSEFFALLKNYEYDYTALNNELCLDWDMIKEMSNSKYCTIGGHTVNHRTLNKLTQDQLASEIINGKRLLEEKTGKPVKHFSYPFGTFDEIGEREVEFVKNCGFDTACYAFGGGITKKNLNKVFELPRIFLSELNR
jgi:peptidoglycan/xylan/chitin deacetylase (PgdA/CDA1 family)